MRREKCYSVLVIIGVVANYKFSFSNIPTMAEIKKALDDKLSIWNKENGDNLTLTARIEGLDVFVNDIKVETVVSEDIFYNNGSPWTLVEKACPEDETCVLVTYEDNSGLHVTQALYKEGRYYFESDTKDGYIDIPIKGVSAWMLQPACYVE